jgi:hypothetical protein
VFSTFPPGISHNANDELTTVLADESRQLRAGSIAVRKNTRLRAGGAMLE